MKYPKLLCHDSALSKTNKFIVPEFIVTKESNQFQALSRICPHRFYEIGEAGEQPEKIVCHFHGFEFNEIGKPVNNKFRLPCNSVDYHQQTGLIFKDFKRCDDLPIVKDVSSENNLQFSHTYHGTSKGSWLWLMEAEADLLHVRKNGIHPWLANEVDAETEVSIDQGDGWIIQYHPTGWWFYLFPFTFIEWAKGCLSINYTIPHDVNNEYGFDWITQIYFDPSIDSDMRRHFNQIEPVFREDIAAIEKQKRPFRPLESDLRLETHSVHFGKWVKENVVLK